MKKPVLFIAVPICALAILASAIACQNKSTTTNTVAKTYTTSSTVTATATAAALFVQVTEPADESIVGDSNITIKGKTLPGAIVSINEYLVDPDSSGSFSLPVTLEEGPNVYDIIASDGDDSSATTQIVVFLAP